MWVHNVLAYSNLFLLPAICKSVIRDNLFESFFILGVMNASFMMHMSETKHGLVPSSAELMRFSSVLLNVDRFFAISSSLYFSAAGLFQIEKYMHLAVLFIAALICLEVGERTKNLKLYVFLHLLWHASVFYIIYVLQGEFKVLWRTLAFPSFGKN